MIPKYDVAVIGAGLVGCATAFELARRGKRVVVVDQGEVNRGASGRNAGSLHFQIEHRMLDLLEHEPDKLAQLIQVNLQAIEDWRRLPELLRSDLEISMRGGVMVCESDAQRALLVRKADLEMRAGLRVSLIEGADLRRAAPYLSEHIPLASYCIDEGHANPRLVTPAYAAAARHAGVVFEIEERVCALEERAQGWRILARRSARPGAAADGAEKVIDAAALLIAAGAWSREILAPLGVSVPLTAVGLCMNVTERVSPLIGHLVQHIGRRLSLKQVKAGNVLIGGGWPATLPSGATLGSNPDTRILEQSIIGNAAVAVHTVPALGQLNLIRSWTGIASIAPDHLPVLGAVSALPGVFIAAGGASFTLGPTYARLVSELICTGKASLPVDLYRPERFDCH